MVRKFALTLSVCPCWLLPQVLVRFAAGPVLLVLALVALSLRKALASFSYPSLVGLG